MLEYLIYALKKTKGETCYNDRRKFIIELDISIDELIEQGIIDGKLNVTGQWID